MKKDPFYRKILLILFGMLLTIVLIEGCLRIANIIYVRQYYPNPDQVSASNKYRILCLGESTTAPDSGFPIEYNRDGEEIDMSWPAQLSEKLDKLAPNRFVVINAAIQNSDSAFLRYKREYYIKKYKPHLVIFMIGSNDHSATIQFHDNITSALRINLYSFKFLKLLKIMKLRLFYDIMQTGPPIEIQHRYKFDVFNDQEQYETFISPHILEEYDYNSSTFELPKKLLASAEMLPKEIVFFVELLRIHLENEDEKRALRVLNVIFKANPYFMGNENTKKIATLIAANQLTKAQNQLQKISASYQKSFLKGMIQIIKNSYTSAIRIAQDMKHFKPVKKRIDQIEILKDHAQYDMSILKPLLENNYQVGVTILRLLLASRNISLPVNLEPQKIIPPLVEHGEHNLSRLFLARYMHDHPNLKYNYSQFIEHALDSGAQVVAMQYPLLPLGPLEDMLSPFKNKIHFVSNESLFLDPLNQGTPYKRLFYDRAMFVGGHCTRTGNHMLVENLLKTILPILKIDEIK